MANMSYCRFENTYRDLEDCLSHINDGDLSGSEKAYRKKIVRACQEVVDEYDEDIIAENEEYDNGSDED